MQSHSRPQAVANAAATQQRLSDMPRRDRQRIDQTLSDVASVEIAAVLNETVTEHL